MRWPTYSRTTTGPSCGPSTSASTTLSPKVRRAVARVAVAHCRTPKADADTSRCTHRTPAQRRGRSVPGAPRSEHELESHSDYPQVPVTADGASKSRPIGRSPHLRFQPYGIRVVRSSSVRMNGAGLVGWLFWPSTRTAPSAITRPVAVASRCFLVLVFTEKPSATFESTLVSSGPTPVQVTSKDTGCRRVELKSSLTNPSP